MLRGRIVIRGAAMVMFGVWFDPPALDDMGGAIPAEINFAAMVGDLASLLSNPFIVAVVVAAIAFRWALPVVSFLMGVSGGDNDLSWGALRAGVGLDLRRSGAHLMWNGSTWFDPDMTPDGRRYDDDADWDNEVPDEYLERGDWDD